MEIATVPQQTTRGSRRNRTPLTCTFCWRVFARKEHLARHQRTHTQEKPFTCSICGKEFSRIACVQCAASRVRCSRDDPCTRCDDRGFDCVYQTSSREQMDSDQPLVPGADASDADIPAGNETRDSAAVIDIAHQTHQPDSETPNNGDSGWMQITDIPQFEPGINWLSPGQTILQEWSSQLADISDGVFVPSFNVLDIPHIPQLPHTDIIADNEVPWNQPSGVYQGDVLTSREESDNHQVGEQSPATLGDEKSTGTSDSTKSKYYVHGVAWRAPFQRRFRNSSDPLASATANNLSSPNNWLSVDAYSRLVLGLHEENHTEMQLPSLESFQLCVHLYFQHLHPNFPFLHKASFLSGEPHWILVLAVACVGATYLRSPEGVKWKDWMMQTVEKILSDRLSQFHLQAQSDLLRPHVDMQGASEMVDGLLPLIQAKILHMLCMLHSNAVYITRRALFERAEMVQWCSYLNLTSESLEISTPFTSDADVGSWIKAQSRLRAGMMIWLLDSMLSYETSCKHMIKLGDIGEWLPCHEEAWEQPSLANIHFAQRFSTNFCHVLLIHAIYRKTTEIVDQSRMRLSSWNPTAGTQDIVDQGSTTEDWPPSSSLASNWRNAACDSLDVLNWAANSKAAESCWEEPTILYLHLSRLVLLAPIVHFQTLARYPLLQPQNRPNAATPSGQSYENSRSQVLQWAIRDQFKARLSVVHAGALLWHVRRFSTDNVIEPFSIYIATLLLWAYSVSTSAVGIRERSDENAVPDDSDVEPEWIHLDRPLDDELVQMYIQNGDKMSAYLKGVGCISRHGAAARILQQGFYLLTGDRYTRNNDGASVPEKAIIYTWDIQRVYADTRIVLKPNSHTRRAAHCANTFFSATA
ncbi:unnamed protein product [Penicillium salamii]|nr:unnamed protein product [Penicillium salamii]CAG8418519.1 unnamed protein product [Penicillium salamii]